MPVDKSIGSFVLAANFKNGILVKLHELIFIASIPIFTKAFKLQISNGVHKKSILIFLRISLVPSFL